MKLDSCIVKSPGQWTRFLLYAKSPQVCSSTNIGIQALLQKQAEAFLDSEQPEWGKKEQ